METFPKLIFNLKKKCHNCFVILLCKYFW